MDGFSTVDESKASLRNAQLALETNSSSVTRQCHLSPIVDDAFLPESVCSETCQVGVYHNLRMTSMHKDLLKIKRIHKLSVASGEKNSHRLAQQESR